MNPTLTFDDGLAVITLDDGKANTMTADRLAALTEQIDTAVDAGALAIVIRSATDLFSAGLDLEWLGSLSADDLETVPAALADALLAVFMAPVPTVAAMPGHAIAGGAVLAMACDVRVGLGARKRLQMNEVAIGIPVPAWMEVVARTAVPEPALSALVQQGAPLRFGEASALGTLDLVNQRDELDPTAMAAARRLAKLDPSAFRVTREMRHRASVESARALL